MPNPKPRTEPAGRHRRILACGAALLMLAALAGCREAPPGTTVVTFWAMGREGELVSQILPGFEREHPDIRVDVQQLPWTAAHEKLLTAFAGDALPDVIQLGNTWIPEFAALGALAPLDARVAATPEFNRPDWFEGTWNTNVIDGRLLGIPWYVDTRLLFYRRDLLAAAGFTAPPRDWNEWRTQLAAVAARATDHRFAVLLPLNEFEPLLNLAIGPGRPLLKDDGTRGNFENPGFRRAFSFYVGLFRDGYAPPMSGSAISNLYDEFARGTFVFFISGPWNIGELRQRLPAPLQSAWATAPLPGPDGPATAIAGGTSLVINRASRHQDAAWELIRYLSMPSTQLRFYALSGDLPPRRSVWREPPLAGDPQAHAFAEQLEHVVPAPQVPEWERIAEQLRIETERVVRGGESIDAALAGLDRGTDAILAKRRWLLAREARK
ncbi:MAG: sugar ABC transporter substrate-binding protein [Lysobacterales bacterium]